MGQLCLGTCGTLSEVESVSHSGLTAEEAAWAVLYTPHAGTPSSWVALSS